MAVITCDVLVEGVQRDILMEWLGDPEVQDSIIRAGFGSGEVKRDGTDWTIHLPISPKARDMGYIFDCVDDSHGGRRVKFNLTGKRTNGTLHYSLRTMKPARNTLVTLHADYDWGGPLGQIIDSLGLRKALENGFRATLEAVKVEAEKLDTDASGNRK